MPEVPKGGAVEFLLYSQKCLNQLLIIILMNNIYNNINGEREIDYK